MEVENGGTSLFHKTVSEILLEVDNLNGGQQVISWQHATRPRPLTSYYSRGPPRLSPLVLRCTPLSPNITLLFENQLVPNPVLVENGASTHAPLPR